MSVQNTLRILVVIPTHDRLDFIDKALQSIKEQTRQPDEIVVIGNVGPGIISHDSLCERLNFVIDRSDCNAFIVLCDDDLIDRLFVEKLEKAMLENKTDIVYTDAQVFGEENYIWKCVDWNKENINQNTVPPLTALCKKSVYLFAGKYQDCPYFDWDFWWRCFYIGATAFHIKEPLFLLRRHGMQLSKVQDHNKVREQFLETRRKLLDSGVESFENVFNQVKL